MVIKCAWRKTSWARTKLHSTEDGKMKASFLDVQSGNIKDIDLTIKADGSNNEEIDIDQFTVE